MDFGINIEQTENEYSNKEIFQNINILLTTVTLQVNSATKNLEIKNLNLCLLIPRVLHLITISNYTCSFSFNCCCRKTGFINNEMAYLSHHYILIFDDDLFISINLMLLNYFKLYLT